MAVRNTKRLLRLQTDVLEAVARGDDLADVGAVLCRHVEKLTTSVICSILLVDDERRLRSLASPSLPAAYSALIDGLLTGPRVGSCGTAVWRGEPVVVTDIERDPLWDGFRGPCLAIGLRACWSSPIRDKDGEVVATFAFYFRRRRGPTEFERDTVETCLHLCALAIEHDRVRARNDRLARFDTLSGLPNRGQFSAALAQWTLEAKPFGLILLDIDHLKLVNDSIGHAAGDALIKAVAERLATRVAGVSAYRIGGDEIAILVPGCADHAALEKAARDILASVPGLVTVGSQSIDAHVTMGGAVFGIDAYAGDTLCQNADFALYEAKQSHRGGYLGFSPGQRSAMVKRMVAVRELDRAMAEDRIVAHYQPIVKLETGQIVGLEALARVDTAKGRLVSVGEFQTALADPRIAYNLTDLMLCHVANDIRTWLDQGISVQHVGINVTTGDFRRGDLAARVRRAFETAGVPLTHVILEVNESVFMGGSDQKVPHAVEALREQGILVALDDFGTGFASLTHLLSFPVDIIKIDRSFVQRLGSDRPAEVVISAILDIARRLGMRVVAEGVETSVHVEMLRDFGCLLGQGYLFSRPVSAGDTTELLRRFAQTSAVRGQGIQALPSSARRLLSK